MNQTLAMLLNWVRDNNNLRMCAWGYFLATQDMDTVDRQYFSNIYFARLRGISA